MWTAKTLIRLGGCPDWYVSSLGAHAILLVLSCAGSYSSYLSTLAVLCQTPYSGVWDPSLGFPWKDQQIITVNCHFNPNMTNGTVHPYQLDESISEFRGVCCILSILISFSIEFPVSKQCRPWSDAVFCGIWSGSALFAYVPKMGR